ncbi:beta-lactamase family protein [Mycobacterium sp. NBC_00419]|uniref:serine hydrolase domain-containing protein n=1 Tax=Mycobacterium sp. NBC_00419 TaxID=2975989 RepID=UPI002E1E0105
MVDAPLMSGFPPAEPTQVTLANWQDPPFNRWAFQHLREVIPTHRVARGWGPVRRLDYHQHPLVPEAVSVHRIEGATSTLADVLADTWTDAVVIVHDGRIVLENYFGPMAADTPHLLMSVTKSFVGCVTGILAADGHLDPDAPVTSYVPEVAGSGYDGATVRNLLDMRSGVQFREEYTDPDAEVRVMERYMGWRPWANGDEVRGMYAYLSTLATASAHGGPFVYRSADTDMLGWVCERVAGVRMADLISQLIWQPLGAEFDAEITCDAVGSAIHDGGMSARARDLARFGQMVLDEGLVDGVPVVPKGWLTQARTIDPDIRSAFASSDSEPFLTGGWYRNQFWFMPGVLGDLQLCLGIHGQMVLVDRATRTVSVKLSTWPAAQNPVYLLDTVRAFVAAGQHAAGLPSAGRHRANLSGPIGVVEGRERGHG